MIAPTVPRQCRQTPIMSIRDEWIREGRSPKMAHKNPLFCLRKPSEITGYRETVCASREVSLEAEILILFCPEPWEYLLLSHTQFGLRWVTSSANINEDNIDWEQKESCNHDSAIERIWFRDWSLSKNEWLLLMSLAIRPTTVSERNEGISRSRSPGMDWEWRQAPSHRVDKGKMQSSQSSGINQLYIIPQPTGKSDDAQRW